MTKCTWKLWFHWEILESVCSHSNEGDPGRDTDYISIKFATLDQETSPRNPSNFWDPTRYVWGKSTRTRQIHKDIFSCFLNQFPAVCTQNFPEPVPDSSEFCFIAVDGYFFHLLFLSSFVLAYTYGLQCRLPMCSTI